MTTRILVVDPDISFMVGLKQGLESSGEFRVSLAANAPAAEDALRHTRYDAAVVAFGLGSLDAMELIRALRAVQPNLRLITTPETPAQRDRAQFMGVQAVVPKPFTAAQLIPHLRRILQTVTQTESPSEEFAPPQMPAELRNLVHPDAADAPGKPRTPTGLLNRFKVGAPTGSSDAEPAAFEDSAHAPEPVIAPPETPEPRPTGPLPPAARRSRMPTAELQWPTERVPRPAPPAPAGTDLEEWQISDKTRPLPPLPLAPAPGAVPRQPEPEDAVRGGEPPSRATRAREFDDLVDAMRSDAGRASRRTKLDDLLASIAADASAEGETADTENTLDYVLNVIRRSPPPSAEESQRADATLEDATIGDVIEGLFEPSFEGVLAALAGQEVPEEDETPFAEPSYGGPGVHEDVAPRGEDQFGPDAFGDAGELPASLDEPPAPQHQEITVPPLDEDLLPFPAPTHEAPPPAAAALSAVSGAEEDDFSLNQLLDQIEHQLPEVRTRRPRLKPLPSWERDADDETVKQLASIFDQEAKASAPARAEDAAPYAWDDLSTQVAPGARADDWADDEVHQAFYEGVREEERVEEGFWAPEPEWAWEPAAPVEVESLWAGEPEPIEPWTEPTEPAAPLESAPGAADEWQPEEAPPPAPEPSAAVEEEALWEAPALVLPEAPAPAEAPPAPEEDEEAQLAQVAVLLTQYSLESSAQATLLTRPGTLVAQAGDLPAAAMARLFDQVDAAWRTSTEDAKSLIRFISLPESGDFLLYSTRVERDLTLSMAFHANTPVRTIRRQAQRLGQSLELVPETAPREGRAPSAPPAPADAPRAPEGLPEAAPAPAAIAVEPAAETAEDQGPRAAYTCLWLPYDPGVELAGTLADDLRGWIEEAAQSAAWELLEVSVRPEYVQVSLSVPQKIVPDEVIGRLMDLTAERSAARYPELSRGTPLWVDGYYVVSPPRELTEREIGRFITYQRQAVVED